MVLASMGPQVVMHLNTNPPENSCRPAVDVLFRSASDIYGGNLLSVVLTGMGYDGLKGCQYIKARGGQVIAQDEESSVVWGMPGAVHEAGAFDKMGSVEECGHVISMLCSH